MSIATIAADVSTLTSDARTALSSLAPLLQTGTATAKDLGAGAAQLTTCAGAIRAVRVDLDALAVEDEQLYPDGGTAIALWRWERSTRYALTRLDGRLTASIAVAKEVQAGQKLTLHTVRAGQSLQAIAAIYLGGWAEWPRIAAANGLKAGPVAVGTVLIIPSKV